MPITDTELKFIASAAIIGESSQPVNGVGLLVTKGYYFAKLSRGAGGNSDPRADLAIDANGCVKVAADRRHIARPRRPSPSLIRRKSPLPHRAQYCKGDFGHRGRSMKTHRIPDGPWLAALIIGLASSGCSTLLPTSKKEVVSDWNSYDTAVKSLSTIQPYKATRADVHKEGLDPRLNPAITVMHFGDVLQRFAAAALIEPQDVDRGIRDCLHAGKQCSGYAISVKKVDRSRVGNFWLDSFNFKRETVTTGWGVDALLVFVDDQLVYQLVGGQPTINEYEVQRNPLGPLQGWGDLASQALR